MIRARVDWRTTWVLAIFIALCMVALFSYWDRRRDAVFAEQQDLVRQACEVRDGGVLTAQGCLLGSSRQRHFRPGNPQPDHPVPGY